MCGSTSRCIVTIVQNESWQQSMITKHDIHTFIEPNRILMRGEDFIYLLPHPALQGWISNYTITFPSTSSISEQYTVIPHGSGTLVFCCDKKGIQGNLFGPATRPCPVGSHANQFDMLFIIEFQPAGLSGLTGIRQKELADRTIPFELIDSSWNRLVYEALERCGSLHELAAGIDRLLLNRLHGVCPAEVRMAIGLMIEHAGSLSTKELSDSVYYSERHLNRVLDQYLGMSNKSFSRLVRINKAIRRLQDPRRTITTVCDLSGYYDLSHFIHDFKSVCEITPQEYRGRLADYYSEIAKF